MRGAPVPEEMRAVERARGETERQALAHLCTQCQPLEVLRVAGEPRGDCLEPDARVGP